MEVVEGTQSPAVGLDGKPVPSSNTSISGANLLKDVSKTNPDENILDYSRAVVLKTAGRTRPHPISRPAA